MSANLDELHLILASSSPFRRELLARLQLYFEVVAPQVDETPLAGECAATLVERLALAKARAVACHRQGLIIGSDQVAEHNGRVVGKPRDHDAAVAQLLDASGSTVTLYTGLALINTERRTEQVDVVPFTVQYRNFDRATAERYLAAEPAYDCCGSLKADGLGIALLRGLDGDDPSALVGLPLIRLVTMLEHEGVHVL